MWRADERGTGRSGSGDPAWSRILLVEGTSGVGKSTLIDRLLRRYVERQPERRLRTLLHLTQAHSYGPVAPAEDDGTLTAARNLAHLEDVVGILEWHVASLTHEAKVKFLAVVDTLHLTHCHRPGVLSWEQVSALDARLARLGARLLFVRAAPETIWARGILPRRAEKFITGYARLRFGATLEALHGHFVAEQERMRRLLARTALRYHEIDADAPLEGNVEAAYRFWLD